jgi:ADP-heptose:LPS heptosyltransferase
MSPRSDVAGIVTELKRARLLAILRLGSIGDVIETVPLAWALRALLPPRTEIVWLAHPQAAPLLARVAAIDDVVVVPRASLFRALPRWRRLLAAVKLDAVLDVHGNLKSAIIDLLTSAPVRIGFDRADCRELWNTLGTNRKLPRLASRNKTRRALEVATLLGDERETPRFDFQFAHHEIERAERVLAALGTGTAPVTVLQLGRARDVRAWPIERCAGLARILVAADWRVLVTGGPDEVEQGDEMRRLLSTEARGIRFELGTLSLNELGALLALLAADERGRHVFVGPDSGPLHLAAACGMRAIGLFGPQDPERTAPIGDRVEVIHHVDAAPCIPCSRRECVHPVSGFCMLDIAADEIARRVQSPPPPRSVPVRAPASGTCAPTRDTAVGSRRLRIPWFAATCSLIVLAPFVFCLIGSGRLIDRLERGAAVAATVLLTTSLARRLGNDRTAVLAGVCLLAMWGYPWSVSQQVVDLDAAALVTASLFFYLEAERSVSWLGEWGFVLSAAAAGAAAYEAGFTGLLLPLLGIILFHAGDRSLRRLFRPTVVASVLLAATGPALLRTALGDRGGSLGPWESFKACARWILVGTLPVTILAPFALFDHFKVRHYREDLGFADRAWRFPKAALVAALALLVVVPAGRAMDQLVVLPLLALLVGAWLERRWRIHA